MRYETLSSPALDALDRDRTVMMIPLGAVEQHGRHMPVGTDTAIAHALCLAVADRGAGPGGDGAAGDGTRRDDTNGATVEAAATGCTVVLPPPWYGLSPHHMRFPGSLTLRAETMLALVGDIVDGLVAHGFRRVLLVNGHGGNGGILDVIVSTIGHHHHGKARVAGVTYFQLAAREIDAIRESGPGGTGHAGEFETSVMMYLHPEQVDAAAGVACYPDAGSPYLSTDLTAARPVRAYQDFGDLSPTGTLGDPGLASAGKGQRFFQACADALDRFVKDFSTWSFPPESL